MIDESRIKSIEKMLESDSYTDLHVNFEELLQENRTREQFDPQIEARLFVAYFKRLNAIRTASHSDVKHCIQFCRLTSKMYGNSTRQYAQALSAYGTIVSFLGKTELQIRLLQRAKTLLTDTKFVDTLVGVLNNLASASLELGNVHNGEKFLRLALKQVESCNNFPNKEFEGNVIANLGILLSNRGRNQEAITLLNRALELRCSVLGRRHIDVGFTLFSISQCFQRMEDRASARRTIAESIEILRAALGSKNIRILGGLTQLAGVLISLHDYVAADMLLRYVETQSKQMFPYAHLHLYRVYIEMGRMYATINCHSMAVDFFEKSLEELSQLGDSRTKAANVARLHLGKSKFHVGAFLEARRILEDGRQIAKEAIGKQSVYDVYSLLLLGSIAAHQNKFDKSREVYLESILLCKKLKLDNSLNRDGQIGYANCLANEGRYAESAKIIEKLLYARRAQSAVISTDVASLNFRLAELYVKLNLQDKVNEHFRRSLELLCAVIKKLAEAFSDFESLNTSAILHYFRSCLLASYNTEIPLDHNTIIDLVRTKGVLEQARAGLIGFQSSNELDMEMISSSSTNARSAEDVSEHPSNGDFNDCPIESSKSIIVSYLSFDTRQSHVNVKSLFEHREKAGYTAVISNENDEVLDVIYLGSKSVIEDCIEQWLACCTSNSAVLDPGKRLRELLWDPVSRYSNGVDQVFVLPDGMVTYVNFATLVAKNGNFLIEEGLLFHSINALSDLHRSTSEDVAGNGALLVGDPDFSFEFPAHSNDTDQEKMGNILEEMAEETFGGKHQDAKMGNESEFGLTYRSAISSELCRLPGTADEVTYIQRKIKANWKNAAIHVLTGSAAAKDAVCALSPGKEILHFATHGYTTTAYRAAQELAANPATTPVGASIYFGNANPMKQAGLALAGASANSGLSVIERQSLLSAEDICQLDLRGVRWAVLSACETGLGRAVHGEGVFGLRRAFRTAGVKTTIMSLWKVEDRFTRKWMAELYCGRYDHGLTTIEAVNSATLKVLQYCRKNNISVNPFYWGAFIAAGDWQ